MNLTIPISVGDFIDRLSILNIKQQHGLQVDEELTQYNDRLVNLPSQSLSHYLNISESVNAQLWQLEDLKRSKSLDVGSTRYIEVSELITHLNDLRFQVKKSIDKHFGSSIQEKKSHE